MSLMYLLTSYLPKHESVYKYLACMDFNQLMEEEENESVYESQGQLLGAVPRILAVNFNAGNYRKRTEAWAGLAIEITKEIETSMTWAQLLSTRWRNMWTRNSQVVYSRLIFPGVLLAFVGALIGWAAWKLIDRAGPELEDLKYGSVTATVIAIVWYALQNVISVFKPISEQMSGYFSSHDYSQELGYQQKVIEDIKFLKGENGKKPYIIFSFIAGEMCKNWWGLWKENVKNTSIPRYGSAPEGKLRIIAFVDDLDQCEESVILPMLWAINLVFRVCEINVILTMDKATIQTAYRKSSLVQERDFVDNFISKLVQLPVNIPDPTDEEWVDFLDQELLRRKQDNEDHLSEERPSNAQCGVDEANGLETEEAGGPKDIESGGRPIQWEGWCITLWIRLLIPRLKGIASRFLNAILFIVCVVICNIRDETPRNLRFSKDDEQLRQSYKRDLSKLARNLRETFLPSYTDEEVITFHRLKRYATGIQKLPREWKCWMNYHKFERNIVSKMPKVKKIANPVGWEVEFVVWTFVCSQWKHEMNALIEEWYNYADEARHDPIRVKLKSSLKEVVANYIKQGMRKEQRGHQVNSTVEDQLGEPTGKQVFIGSNSSSAGSVEKELERWKILQNCLESVHDVSLEGLRCFQHYRYHCDARNLVSKHHAKELSSSYGDTK
ncbi:uncharacterized protein LOC131042697 [Cryptomeria japonica]|uniref:uncharacterized protein LOC131042697 n=1 Tax=Cryptomeria japonica TaxID=3369 RepID=UPI0027DA9AB2|nr:uncharacterized protein LOC131042697 [Cryptomeria japonica]